MSSLSFFSLKVQLPGCGSLSLYPPPAPSAAKLRGEYIYIYIAGCNPRLSRARPNFSHPMPHAGQEARQPPPPHGPPRRGPRSTGLAPPPPRARGHRDRISCCDSPMDSPRPRLRVCWMCRLSLLPRKARVERCENRSRGDESGQTREWSETREWSDKICLKCVI